MSQFERMSAWVRIVVVAGCAAALACTSTEPEPSVTWHDDIAPLVQQRCASCHDGTGIGPLQLTDPAEAKAVAAQILDAVDSGRMPPWLPAAGPAFVGDRRLSAEEKQLLHTWVDEGAPLGKARAAPTSTDTSDAVEADAVIQMAAPYHPNQAWSDDYRCFVLDPKLTTDQAVVGFDIRPGNRRMVHHVILFAVAEDEVPRLLRKEAEDSVDGYTCFGDANVDAEMVGAWVPGTSATVFPPQTGILLPKRGRLVMQVHYNTLESRGESDQTSVVLDYSAPGMVSRAMIFPVVDDSFRIAPDEVKTVRTTYDTRDLNLPRGLQIKLHGLAPHMHLHGQSIRVGIERESGASESLIDIPRWDFHWQQMYFYEEPVRLNIGDKVYLECTFDNRAESQPVINGRRTDPAELRWGEGTLEEMCLNFFYATL